MKANSHPFLFVRVVIFYGQQPKKKPAEKKKPGQNDEVAWQPKKSKITFITLRILRASTRGGDRWAEKDYGRDKNRFCYTSSIFDRIFFICVRNPI